MKNNKLNYKSAFTLVEIMIGVLIFSMVIIGGFKAYSGVLLGKVKLIESTDIQKQAFYFSEKFFEEIKKGGTIDYEEYFNRTVVGTGVTNGYYNTRTGFGNYGTNKNPGDSDYGDSFYYCRSKDGTSMGTGGCVEDFNTVGSSVKGKAQRYGQYSFHFIDYNSNADDDEYNGNTLLGDEDGDGNIIGDDDDEYLGIGPVAFSGTEVKEIYLISADKRKRTFFRWKIQDDPDDPNNNCDFTTGSGGCHSTLEFLKLTGKDWGFDHDISNTDKKGEYDGVVDTWVINKDFAGGTEPIAGKESIDKYWQPLFGDNINVSNLKFYLYPNKDLNLSWKDFNEKINISPYIRIKMELTPTYKARKGIKGKIPKIKINTTINLTDIYSR